MFGRFMPNEGKFFELFVQHAELCVKGAKEMVALMTRPFLSAQMRVLMPYLRRQRRYPAVKHSRCSLARCRPRSPLSGQRFASPHHDWLTCCRRFGRTKTSQTPCVDC